MKNERISFQLRVDAELRDKLKIIAKSEGRSMNNLIEQTLRKAVERYLNDEQPPVKK